MINEPFYEEETILAHKIFVNILHSLNSSYELSPNLYEFYRPFNVENSVLDIVFVHGN